MEYSSEKDVTLLDRLYRFLQATPIFRWFFRPGYLQGVFWANMISVVAVSNDVLMRFLGERLHIIEISFFRFFLSTVVLLPFMLGQRCALFQTKVPYMHLARGVVGAGAIALCCWSVNVMPLAQNTTLMFMQPLFFLPLAFVFLKEKVGAQRWLATLLGFIGLWYIVRPGMVDFHIHSLIPLGAAFLFATLDILAKKMVVHEKTLTLLFYFGLVTTLISLPFVFPVWQMPTKSEFVYLLFLGIGGNLIQVCLFLAFSATEASALAPFRYGEFIIASLFGYIFFSQIPSNTLLFGSCIIIASAFYLSHIEVQSENAQNAIES